MHSLNINLRFEDHYEQLDTIEERSQEFTPVYDINRQLSRDWGKLHTLSLQNKPSLRNISEDEQEAIQTAKISRANSKRQKSKKTLKQILALKKKLTRLENQIKTNKQEISKTESENSELEAKIQGMQKEPKVKVSSHMCKNLCSIF